MHVAGIFLWFFRRLVWSCYVWPRVISISEHVDERVKGYDKWHWLASNCSLCYIYLYHMQKGCERSTEESGKERIKFVFIQWGFAPWSKTGKLRGQKKEALISDLIFFNSFRNDAALSFLPTATVTASRKFSCHICCLPAPGSQVLLSPLNLGKHTNLYSFHLAPSTCGSCYPQCP